MAPWVAPAIIGGSMLGSAAIGAFGSSGGSATSKKKSMLRGDQSNLLAQMIKEAQERQGGPAPNSPGTYAPPNQTEQQLFGWARSQAVKDMLQGKVPYEVGPQYAEKYYEEAIKPEMMANWEDIVMPQIRESYAGPGYWSSDRMRQETESAEQLSRDLSSKRSELMYSEELAKRQAIENAMGRIPGMAGAVGNVGAMERDVEREKLMSNLTKFLMGEEVDGEYNPSYNPAMQDALNLIGIRAVSRVGMSQGPNTAYGMAQGLGQGMGQVFPSLLANLFTPRANYGGGGQQSYNWPGYGNQGQYSSGGV